MKYDDEYRSVFNSELAVKVMKIIGSTEGGDYGSSIAQTLGKSQASISRVLRSLHSMDFVEKGEREKAQYYQLDYAGIGEFWYEFVYEKLKESDEEIRRRKWLVDEYTDKEEMLQGFEENRQEIIDTVAGYVQEVFEGRSSVQKLTVSDILFQQFGLSMGHNMINRTGFMERNRFLEYPKDALIHLWNLEGFAPELNRVLEDDDGGVVIKKKGG